VSQTALVIDIFSMLFSTPTAAAEVRISSTNDDDDDDNGDDNYSHYYVFIAIVDNR